MSLKSEALANAVALIKRWEGCKLAAYPDPATGGNPWTIGYGATGPGIRQGVRWTQAQADDRLAQDVERFMTSVLALVDVDMAHPRATEIGALTSFAYNVGLANLKNSTLLRKYNAGDKAGAASEFARWNRAAGKIMRGLTARRADERAVFVRDALNPVRQDTGD